MSTAVPSADSPAVESLASLIGAVLRKLIAVWLVAAAVSFVVTWAIVPELIGASVLVAIWSGLISIAALLPGRRLGRSIHPLGDAGALPTVIVLAMAIRVTGTVALLLFCRYQMDHQLPTLALLVGAWYLLLTSVEVSLLARGARSLSSTGKPESG